MHMPHQIEIKFALCYKFFSSILEIEGHMEVELVLKNAIARVEHVVEIISILETIS